MASRQSVSYVCVLAGVSKLYVWVPEVGPHGGVALRAGVSMAGSQKKLCPSR